MTCEQFQRNLGSRIQEQEAALRRRCDGLKGSWEAVDAKRVELKDRMVARDAVFADSGRDTVNLNVGGTPFTVRRSILTRVKGSRLAALFGVDWGGTRLPRDSDGRIFLDESPSSFERILNLLLDRVPYTTLGWSDSLVFRHCVEFFGLADFAVSGLLPLVVGSSTILTPASDQPRYLEYIKRWCSGSLLSLNLLYRGTRDGFTSEAFHRLCNKTTPTLTVIRCGEAVVGGYSDQPWSGDEGFVASTGTFIFSLRNKDGVLDPSQMPVTSTGTSSAVYRTSSAGPCFGESNDLRVRFKSCGTAPTLSTSNKRCGQFYPTSYLIDESHMLHSLRGSIITDIEVFGVNSAVGTAPNRIASPSITPDSAKGRRGDKIHTLSDLDTFGAAVARELERQEIALDSARDDLVEEWSTYEAAEGALEVLQRGGVVAGEGEEDPVVELNVGGMFMSTLLSTLCLCPGSTLALMFKDQMDITPEDQGAPLFVLDCDPLYFGQILDVLRARKKEKARSVEEGSARRGFQSVVPLDNQVGISPDERGEFEELVRRFFAGNESFIMDMVDTSSYGWCGQTRDKAKVVDKGLEEEKTRMTAPDWSDSSDQQDDKRGEEDEQEDDQVVAI